MDGLYKYYNNKIVMNEYFENICHNLRTPLQIISGTAENAIENMDVRNENSRYDKDMKLINRNCNILIDIVEGFIQDMKNLHEFNQFFNNSDLYKESEDRFRRYYLLNKWSIDKKGTFNLL